ncbi:MAG: hypothetical protein ABJO67_02015 [Pseudoruegeria sp.]
MKMSLNQAAKTCGRAKSTISDAIKSGRLSASKDDRGRYQIDTSELHRVFPFKATEQSEPDTNRTEEPEPNTPEIHLKNTGLEREVELLREMLEKSETNADHWRKMAERQQILLEDSRPKGFFKRLLGQ